VKKKRFSVSARRACRVIRTTRSSAYYKTGRDRAGADARAVWQPPPARPPATRRLEGRQRALLSGVYRGRAGAPAEAPLAPRDGCPSGAAAPPRRATTSGAWISRPTLADGRRFLTLTIIDPFTRECLAIDLGEGLSGQDVAAALERLRFERGLPQRISVPYACRRRCARLATAKTSSTGSMGFTRCMSKPLAKEEIRSCARAYAVSAAAGVLRSGSAIRRTARTS
jgi:transposase InsO family protein